MALPGEIKAQLDWIRQTTLRLPQNLPLPEGFNPLTADREQLSHHGFPPRPDPATQRELSDVWIELFSPPLEFDLLPDLTAELDFALPIQFRSAGNATTPSRREGSLNWSGGYITPRDGQMFTHVVGSFEVPTVSAPPGMPEQGEYASSTWIGIDGQRSYLHSTLPQIGTAQHLNLGGTHGRTTTAWVQWWPLVPFTFRHFTVNPGDRVTCWLSVVDSTHVLAIIKNTTTGGIRMLVMQAPMVIDPPRFPDPIQAEVSGATAEWVTERPAHLECPELYELPDYDEVVFKHCYAVSALGPDSAGRVEKLVGPRLIRMYRVAEDPHRSVTISVAERLGEESVKTFYHR